jgi:hypothetical protein
MPPPEDLSKVNPGNEFMAFLVMGPFGLKHASLSGDQFQHTGTGKSRKHTKKTGKSIWSWRSSTSNSVASGKISLTREQTRTRSKF